MVLFGYLVVAAMGLVSGCERRPPVIARPLPSPIVSREEALLDPALLEPLPGEAEGDAYRVGPGDSILVAVYRHPELSIASYSGSTIAAAGQGARPAGLIVDNDGTVQFPLVGSLKVAGKTSDELRVYLEQQLSLYLNEPKVTVQVVFTGSIRYYLLGMFSQPGLKYSDRPLHLLEALALGGSVQMENASLSTAYVARHGRRLAINFRRLLLQGDLRQNIQLHTGDVIFVPDNSAEQAFVFRGALDGAGPRGGNVPFVHGQLDLIQALAAVGYSFRERVRGRLSETRIIRSDGDHGQLFIVDADKMIRGEAAAFPLMPGDVVFVPETSFANWNEAITEILPNLQAISALLSPFVQIKYLSQ